MRFGLALSTGVGKVCSYLARWLRRGHAQPVNRPFTCPLLPTSQSIIATHAKSTSRVHNPHPVIVGTPSPANTQHLPVNSYRHTQTSASGPQQTHRSFFRHVQARVF